MARPVPAGQPVTDLTVDALVRVKEAIDRDRERVAHENRRIVFCHADDRPQLEEACRVLRAEGVEIAVRVSSIVEPGTAYAVKADQLQPGAFLKGDLWPST